MASTAGQRERAAGAWSDFHRNNRYEEQLRTADGRRAIRDETDRSGRLRDRAHGAERPLSAGMRQL